MQLSPEDLQELQLRKQALNAARFNFLMVEEAFNTWMRGIGHKYHVPGANFTVALDNGEVSLPKPTTPTVAAPPADAVPLS